MQVNPVDRIIAIIGNDMLMDETIELSYSWVGGYEKLDIIHLDRKGGFHYEGAYHPDSVCVGNPCQYCGAAYYEEGDF